jgi:hypothetical protein
MKRAFRLAVLFFTLVCGVCLGADGVAISIVFDTSGSMLESVNDRAGKPAQKFVVGRSAMETVVGRLDAFAKSGGKPLQVALFTFDGKAGAREVLPMGAFDAKKLKDALPGRDAIAGATPLGRATEAAALALKKAKADSRHILVLTDGANTVGPQPEAVMAAVDAKSAKDGMPVQVHFLAFDVSASVFAGVKKAGATVVSAGDEAQLVEKLSVLLEEKILLEKE